MTDRKTKREAAKAEIIPTTLPAPQEKPENQVFTDGERKKLCYEILNRVAEGEMLGPILMSDVRYPRPQLFYRWMRENPELKEDYEIARQCYGEKLASETIEIADNMTIEHYHRDKARIAVREWHAPRLAPELFERKARVEHSGPEGGAIPVRMEVVIVDPDEKMKTIDHE